jgi:hypothetical protein
MAFLYKKHGTYKYRFFPFLTGSENMGAWGLSFTENFSLDIKNILLQYSYPPIIVKPLII